MPEPRTTASPLQSNSSQNATFSKVFRWRLPDGRTEPPQKVEIAGSFTHWQKVPLTRDGAQDAWHATVHHIPSHRTHHYMMFVDGQPVFDKTCDGYAIPHGPVEEAHAIPTPRGPRLLMLFSQTK
jgi:hypothetical protein